MKRNSVIPIILTSSITISALAAETTNNVSTLVLGVSPFYSAPASAEIEYNIKKFALDAPKGSKIRVDDAFNLRTIVDLSPPTLRYDSPANRMRFLVPSFAKLSQWFAQTRRNATSAELTNSALLRVPEFLDFLASSGSAEPGGILLIGSPFVEYPTEPSFSMTGGVEGPRVPSDGHLRAGVQTTPYGTVERKGRLRGAQISWCYGNENVWANELAKTVVTRFWVLFVAQQDATLVAFTPDLPSVFANLPKTGLPAVASFALNPEDTKIEMRVVRPRQVPAWLPSTDETPNVLAAAEALRRLIAASPQAEVARIQNAAQPSLLPRQSTPPQQAAVAVTQPAARPVETARPVLNLAQPIGSQLDIGLMWTARVDLDLYVRARRDSHEIWFQKAQTPDGVLIKDWTQPNDQADFEWVKLNPGVRLDQVEVWVNLFKGPGPVTGRVAVHFENRSYTGSFTITAPSGNGGVDAAARATSPYWTRLDLQKILTQNP